MGQPLQKIPVRNKLSYLWARATGEDRLCSHVFTDNNRQAVYAEPGWGHGISYYQTRYYFHWLEARPFNGQENQYVITAFTYKRNGASSVTGDREIDESLLKLTNGRSVFSREEAKEIIAIKEREWTQSGMLPLKSQPFNGFIATSLAPKPA